MTSDYVSLWKLKKIKQEKKDFWLGNNSRFKYCYFLRKLVLLKQISLKIITYGAANHSAALIMQGNKMDNWHSTPIIVFFVFFCNNFCCFSKMIQTRVWAISNKDFEGNYQITRYWVRICSNQSLQQSITLMLKRQDNH